MRHALVVHGMDTPLFLAVAAVVVVMVAALLVVVVG